MEKLPLSPIVHLSGPTGVGKNYAMELTGLRSSQVTPEPSWSGGSPRLNPKKIDWTADIIVIDEVWYWDQSDIAPVLERICQEARDKRKLLVLIGQCKEDFEKLKYQPPVEPLGVYLHRREDAEVLAPALKQLALEVSVQA